MHGGLQVPKGHAFNLSRGIVHVSHARVTPRYCQPDRARDSGRLPGRREPGEGRAQTSIARHNLRRHGTLGTSSEAMRAWYCRAPSTGGLAHVSGDPVLTEVTSVGVSRDEERTVPVVPRRDSVVVAPEVAERIMARRAAGELPTAISRDLHMTPVEVLNVLRAAERQVSW